MPPKGIGEFQHGGTLIDLGIATGTTQGAIKNA